MRFLLACPEKAKKTNVTDTTHHLLDRGLGSVGQRFTVEGGRPGCALQLAPLTVPRVIAPLIYAVPAD